MSPVKLSLLERLKLFKKKLEVSWRFHFAHHPLCDAYSDHVWSFFGIYICQGCTLVTLGIIASFLLSFILNLSLATFEWLFFGLSILILLFIVEISNIKVRNIKRFVRFMTGIGLGSFFWLILSESNVVILVVSLIFTYIGYQVFKRIRFSTQSEDKCLNCVEFTKEGVCSGLELEIKAERKYSEYATDLLYDKLHKRAKKLQIKKQGHKKAPFNEENLSKPTEKEKI